MPPHDRNFCISSYLAFRYVVAADAAWAPGLTPGLPELLDAEQVAVDTPESVRAALEELLGEATDGGEEVGVLLSGGMDSAILAALLPEGTKAFSVRFAAEGAIDESAAARQYAETKGLDLRVVEVTWDDYLEYTPPLMRRKQSPLHAVEPGLFKAAKVAADAGVRTLVLGNGADSTFGGLDKLLSRDWDIHAFARRYTFIDPADAVTHPVSMFPEYEKYQIGDSIDVVSFLKTTHGIGIIQAFENAIRAAGCQSLEPYEHLKLAGELDLARIRAGEPKYVLQALFRMLYPDLDPPPKLPFVRPMDRWLADWMGPVRPEFNADLDIRDFSGDQRWILWCLEQFLDQIEGELA